MTTSGLIWRQRQPDGTLPFPLFARKSTAASPPSRVAGSAAIGLVTWAFRGLLLPRRRDG